MMIAVQLMRAFPGARIYYSERIKRDPWEACCIDKLLQPGMELWLTARGFKLVWVADLSSYAVVSIKDPDSERKTFVHVLTSAEDYITSTYGKRALGRVKSVLIEAGAISE